MSRWRTELSTRLDRLLGSIENREALAEVVLEDLRRAANRAEAWLAEVRRDADQLGCELERQLEAERRWRERALGAAGEDETRALECLLHSRRAGRAALDLAGQLEGHRRIERGLRAEIERLEERHSQLTSRRNLMRTRQAGGRAAIAERIPEGDLAVVFDRWEAQLAELELGRRAAEDEFLDGGPAEEDDEESLRAELAELLTQTTDREDS